MTSHFSSPSHLSSFSRPFQVCRALSPARTGALRLFACVSPSLSVQLRARALGSVGIIHGCLGPRQLGRDRARRACDARDPVGAPPNGWGLAPAAAAAGECDPGSAGTTSCPGRGKGADRKDCPSLPRRVGLGEGGGGVFCMSVLCILSDSPLGSSAKSPGKVRGPLDGENPRARRQGKSAGLDEHPDPPSGHTPRAPRRLARISTIH